MKFDFLGLKTLTVIDRAAAMIDAARPGEPPLDMDALPTDDAQTYELIRSGATTGVFQLESRGMRELLRGLKPSRFEDLVALVALFRPGPLKSGMVDDFIERKEGRAEVAYLHPQVEPILRSTHGVILYQEAGDADRPRAGRIQPRRRRRAPQGDGQEAARGDGAGAGRVRRRRDPARGGPARRERPLRPHGALRRVRVQSGALRFLRPRLLPDRVAQAPSSGRVHGFRPHRGNGQHGSGGAPRGRLPRPRDHRPAARRERERVGVRGGRRGSDPLRARRDPGSGARRGREHRRGPGGERPVHRSLRFLPPGGFPPDEPPGTGSVDPRGRAGSPWPGAPRDDGGPRPRNAVRRARCPRFRGQASPTSSGERARGGGIPGGSGVRDGRPPGRRAPDPRHLSLRPPPSSRTRRSSSSSRAVGSRISARAGRACRSRPGSSSPCAR